MFDISWGEILVVGVVGAAVTGRKDLPAACRVVGTQLGRVVGLLQGARARADQFTAKNELRQLQNELRSGLRELDQVRTELAVAVSSQGMVGRTLGATTPSANRVVTAASSSSSSSSSNNMHTIRSPSALGGATNLSAGITAGGSLNSAISAASATTSVATSTTMSSLVGDGLSAAMMPPASSADDSANATTDSSQTIAFDLPAPDQKIPLASLASHSEKAALEDEWEKQGIGYQTQAEQLYRQQNSHSSGPATGSELLEALIKQNLIWDQYDRVVGEQDSQLQGRIEAMKAKRQGKKDDNTDDDSNGKLD
jgi:Sec-independent protein translocase protein TatA